LVLPPEFGVAKTIPMEARAVAPLYAFTTLNAAA
tara:strand:- start:652 stop:753 length:102 start_codon:yes stop_codon:yes gene_type:complete